MSNVARRIIGAWNVVVVVAAAGAAGLLHRAVLLITVVTAHGLLSTICRLGDDNWLISLDQGDSKTFTFECI